MNRVMLVVHRLFSLSLCPAITMSAMGDIVAANESQLYSAAEQDLILFSVHNIHYLPRTIAKALAM